MVETAEERMAVSASESHVGISSVQSSPWAMKTDGGGARPPALMLGRPLSPYVRHTKKWSGPVEPWHRTQGAKVDSRRQCSWKPFRQT